MARAGSHSDGEYSNGMDGANATSLVFCSVSAVAQAVTRSLDLTRVFQLPMEHTLAGPLRWPWAGREPELAIVIDSNVQVIVSTVRAIKRRWKQIRVLVVGLHNAQAAIVSCVEAGADGLFMADEPLERLPAAVQDLLAGKFRPPPNLLKIWAAETQDSAPARNGRAGQLARVVALAPTKGRPSAGRASKPLPWTGGLPVATSEGGGSAKAGDGRSLGRKLNGR